VPGELLDRSWTALLRASTVDTGMHVPDAVDPHIKIVGVMADGDA